MNVLFGAIIAMFGGGDMELVNTKSGFVVVEQRAHEVVFNDPILEEQMIEFGVAIPPSHQKKYGGRERIRFGEYQFFDAFKEFYCTYVFDPDVYQWKLID